ncbi:MAG: hypothetical protein EOO52_14975 [Gammaproteobacteria bacterium]|nr:MAG: hypothetical protein EOO52_14975 [Gammaproteobacteria bacterium]
MLAFGCLADIKKNSSALKNSNSLECKLTPVKQSKAAIEAILKDLDSNYLEIGGGGISEVKQTRTNVYVVSIPQGERIDQFSYEISVDEACKVNILKKEPFTKNFSR